MTENNKIPNKDLTQSQYGEIDNDEEFERVIKSNSLGRNFGRKENNIKIIDKKSVMVKDNIGVFASVPQQKYVQELENRIAKLETDKNILKTSIKKTQISLTTLEKRVESISESIKWLTDRY